MKIHHIKVSSASSVYHRKNKLFYQFPGEPLASPLVGRCGCNVGHGHNASHFHLSCVGLVCFWGKSIDLYDIRMECKRILIHLLLIISHV